MNDPVIIAVFAKGFLHRDISVANIILFRRKVGEQRDGVLIDWEFACDILQDLLASECSMTVRHIDNCYAVTQSHDLSRALLPSCPHMC